MAVTLEVCPDVVKVMLTEETYLRAGYSTPVT